MIIEGKSSSILVTRNAEIIGQLSIILMTLLWGDVLSNGLAIVTREMY